MNLQECAVASLNKNTESALMLMMRMADDYLISNDIEAIILSGVIAQRFTEDERGRRYAVLGDTLDGRKAYVICRLLLSGVLLVITAYVAEEE